MTVLKRSTATYFLWNVWFQNMIINMINLRLVLLFLQKFEYNMIYSLKLY